MPLVTELMDQGTTQAIEDFKHLGLPTDVEALLLVAVDGDADLVQREIAVVADVLKRPARGICGTRGRRRSRRRCGRRGGTSARPSPGWRATSWARTSRCRAAASRRWSRGGRDRPANDLRIIVYGHIGDGNLHPTILSTAATRR